MVSTPTENNNTGGELRRTVRRVPQARRRQRRRHRQGHRDPRRQGLRRRRHRLQVRGPDPARRVHAAPTATVGVKAGDEVDVLLESRENDDGMVVLSKEKADKMQGLGRDLAPRASATSSSRAPSSQRVKGGLSVTIRGGVKAFLPGSQVDLRPVRNLDKFIGQTYRVQGHQVQQEARQHRAVAPRAPREGARRAEGARRSRTSRRAQVVKGIVKNITEYGAFIDLGGIDGLLHITDMSLGPRQPPVRDVPGRRRGHASRSSSSTPRPSASRSASSRSRKTRGTTPTRSTRPARASRGKVVSLTDYGAFVELEQGIEGLVHVSRDVLDQAGQAPVEGASTSATRSRPWCSTSTRRPSASPRHEAARAEPVDAARRRSTRPAPSSRARSATSPTSASSSEIEEGIDGLVHISRHVAGPSASSTPSELYQKGDEVEAVVLNIDHDEKQASRSASSSSSHDPWDRIPERLPGRQGRRGQGHQGRSTSARSSRSSRASRAWSTSPSSPRSASRTRRRS